MNFYNQLKLVLKKAPTDVTLLLESSVSVNKDDNFHIKVERNESDETRFVFDSLLSFFDEE